MIAMRRLPILTSKHTGAAFDRAYARLEVADHIGDLQSADGETSKASFQLHAHWRRSTARCTCAIWRSSASSHTT